MNIAILGSTGSIGTQTLEVIAENPTLFNVSALTAGRNADLLIQQAKVFQPKHVVIGDEAQYDYVKKALSQTTIEVHSGENALCAVATLNEVDTVLTALVGYAGLLPTIEAIKAKKNIALANKETLVVGGEIIMPLAKENGIDIIPVDSEHSAIFQSLVGEPYESIEKVILTASGGPFRGKSASELAHITKAQALKHPNWEMGAKITIDSATLMNKGLEVIEAKWLFDLSDNQIDVIVHPQSIIHSLVQFVDSSIKAQLGLPDMKLPIQYALGFPKRLANNFKRFDFMDYPNFTFEKPDIETFKNLGLAFAAMGKKGNAPCVLNAANEISVAAFLKNQIGFLEIAELNSFCMDKVEHIQQPTLEDLVQSDKITRELAQTYIQEQVGSNNS